MITPAQARVEKRQARKALSPYYRQHASERIMQSVAATRRYEDCTTIALYYALPEEVATNALIERAWADGKQVYLPVVEGKQQPLNFALFTPNSTLVSDAMGMMVPREHPSEYQQVTALDVIVVPLVAFDTDCRRVGMGGGFYDRTLTCTQSNVYTIGIAYDVQKTSQRIETASWDVALDAVISEENHYGSL